MLDTIKMPSMGMTMVEGTVAKWNVNDGDAIKEGQVLLEIESEKTVAEVEAPFSGVFCRRLCAEGEVLLVDAPLGVLADGAVPRAQVDAFIAALGAGASDATPVAADAAPLPAGGFVPASPAVRKLARDLGVELAQVKGTGSKGRVERADVELFAKAGAVLAAVPCPPAPVAQVAAAAQAAAVGLDLLPWPQVDFAAFGPVERKDVSRLRKLAAANLHRNWVSIPHVTSNDEADVTELEPFRVQMNKELGRTGVKLSLLPFLVKAAVSALKQFPEFNASLEKTADGHALVLKRYYHIGFAADTPQGLLVPVIRDADRKSVPELAKEMNELAQLAREGKLKPEQMQGGGFTISSLGGVGGTHFTPIINAPEVAIMGVCKTFWKQHSTDGQHWRSRLMLPLSLSWDHRAIDGAAAARFNVHFASVLADLRRVLF